APGQAGGDGEQQADEEDALGQVLGVERLVDVGGDVGEHQDPELDGAAGELVDGGDRGRERVVDRRRVALAGAQLVDGVGQRGDRRVGAVGGGRPLPVLPDGRLPQALGGVGHRAGGDLVGGEQRRVAGGGVAADGGLGLDDRLGEQRGV